MKYDNVKLHTSYIWALLLCGLLSACGTTQKKDDDDGIEKPLVIMATKDYLPVRQYDKEGLQVPFVASPNPYLDIKGKIDKQVIVDYIAARKAFKSDKFDETEALLKKIIQADKTLAGPWVMLGDIATQKKAFDQAIAHYQKAIEVNPLNVNAYLPLAKLQREKGEFIKAQNTYTQALAVWKDFPEAHLNLAILYDIYLNDPLQAQQHMEAYQFLTEENDPTVEKWLQEIQARTGIAPNLYIGPSNTSQIEQTEAKQSES